MASLDDVSKNCGAAAYIMYACKTGYFQLRDIGMVSLYKRATPAQELLLHIVEGAVLNAMDAHNIKRDPRMARSIAKRAAGTLSAQWQDVLAANTGPSGKRTASQNGNRCRACERRANLVELRACKERSAHSTLRQLERGASQFNRRFPLLTLWKRLQRQMWYLRRNDQVKFEARVELLRMIDKLHKEMIEASNEKDQGTAA